ncbi:Uncharacterised protein [Klebsiella pneumoniae]|uniref:Uncharacterized protein n=1 Tax=Klebsiella pneumoniae TaxID=573 RepID=A0A2X1SCT4_KLEPN|nr:Uncharacterised protein [Klebsiella pneumoniae]
MFGEDPWMYSKDMPDQSLFKILCKCLSQK